MINDRVDIIIPAYKAHETMLRTLSSIACQSILQSIDVIIVNDGCPEGSYQEYVNLYSKYMSICELVLEKNSGPAYARQYGLDHSINEFVIFVDADDTLNGSHAVEILKSRIEESPDFQCCSSFFNEVMDGGKRILMHQQDMTWLFGKIYRRSFLERHHIRFIDSRASNQDVGFNALVQLYCNNESERICFSDDCTYTWMFRKDSITTENNFQFEYDQSICGYVDNMIYVSHHVSENLPEYDLSEWLTFVLSALYCKWNMVLDQNPFFAEQCWNYIRKFYGLSYLKYYQGLDMTRWKSIVFNTIKEQNTNPSMDSVIPFFTMYQFVEKLNSEPLLEGEII